MMKLAGLRWYITGLLFLAAVLNYVDKNTLALLAPTIQKDLGLTDQDYANIQNAFQVAYTIALLASGVIVDKLGPRISLALFVGWWSLANVFTAAARSVFSLGFYRFLLGLGEAGNWTASPKTVSEWFPAKERGLAMGIYTAGTPIGMTLAPLFIIWLAEAFGWRSAFVVTGIFGLVWLVPWLVLYPRKWHGQPDHESGNGGTADHGQDARVTQGGATTEERGWGWLESFRQPVVWCLLIGRMLSDPIWFFYQNWYPKYLVSARGLTQAEVKITWVMFLAAGVGSLIGGWITGRFIKRGGSPSHVRLFTMLGCACFMPLSPLVASVPTVEWSLALASVIAFAHLAWLVNIGALVVDVVPKKSLGSVFGIVAAGSSLGAIIMNDLVAKLVKTGGYNQWYIIAAGLHLIAIVVLMAGILRRKTT
jgi:ACS family hexuronate transporter-like MFS transporter